MSTMILRRKELNDQDSSGGSPKEAREALPPLLFFFPVIFSLLQFLALIFTAKSRIRKSRIFIDSSLKCHPKEAEISKFSAGGPPDPPLTWGVTIQTPLPISTPLK